MDEIKVAFNARILNDSNLRGWNRYTVNLISRLPEYGVRPYLYSDRPIHGDHLNTLPKSAFEVRIAPPGLNYTYWEQVWIPGRIRDDQAALFHCPFNFGLPAAAGVPTVLTLHDATEFAHISRNRSFLSVLNRAGLSTRFHHWIARARASRVITVSEFSKREIMKYFRISRDKIDVIYEAADPNFHRSVAGDFKERVLKKHGLDSPYFLWVGGWEERKNVPFLMKSFAETGDTGTILVIAGGGDRGPLEELAKDLDIRMRVRFLGRIEDDELPSLYAGARAFIYPSLYEGFGLQLCEAMAVGCPVFAADRASLPEILGEGGELFPLDGTGPLAELMIRAAKDDEFVRHLSARARARSGDFDWKKTAEMTVQVYRRLLDA